MVNSLNLKITGAKAPIVPVLTSPLGFLMVNCEVKILAEVISEYGGSNKPRSEKLE